MCISFFFKSHLCQLLTPAKGGGHVTTGVCWQNNFRSYEPILMDLETDD